MAANKSGPRELGRGKDSKEGVGGGIIVVVKAGWWLDDYFFVARMYPLFRPGTCCCKKLGWSSSSFVFVENIIII